MTKSCVLFFLIIFIGLCAQSQDDPAYLNTTNKIDSLETIVFTTSITNEKSPGMVDICNKLAEQYSKLGYSQQIEYASNIKTIANKLNDNSTSINLFSIIANAYFNIGNYNNSIEIYNKIYNLYSNGGDEIKTAAVLMKIGQNYYAMNQYVKAKAYYERALDVFKSNQYFTGIANALQSIAIILSHWGEYDKALHFNFDALNFWKEINNTFQIATVNYNVGIIYQELGDLNQAKEYFQKCLNMFVGMNSVKEIVNSTARIGDIYLHNNEHLIALEYYLKADVIGQQINNKTLKAENSFNLGKAYNLIGDYFKAISYQRKAIKLNEELKNMKALAENYAELGLAYFNIGYLDQALNNLYQGLEISQSLNYKYQTTICYKNLSDVYSKLGRFNEAFSCYKNYIEGRDQINSEESKLKTTELLTKYQVSVKEKENELLRHNDQLKNAQINNQWLIIAFVAFALLGLLIVSTIFRKRYKSNRKLNVQLSLKNKEIENHQKKVEHLNTDLSSANVAKDRFFSIIAHDLKNPFNSLMGLIELLIEDYYDYKDDERQEFLVQMKNSSDRIFALLQNLLLWGSNQLGKTELMKEKIDLSKIARDCISLIHSVADKKNISIRLDIPNGTFAYADKNMVSTVILNLITNAIKFTPQDGTVKIKTVLRDHEVEVMIADSGVGISPMNLEKLFRLDEKIQSDGTEKEKGTGLGLILCKEFIEKNNGKIWAESIENKGSRFYFTLPNLPNESEPSNKSIKTAKNTVPISV